MSQLSRLIPTSGPGSGTVTSIAAGTGITLTPNPITTTGTVALTIPVTIADGGTNATSMTTTDGTVYFDGTRLVTTTTGTAGFVLTSNGVAAPTYQAVSASGAVMTLTGNSGGSVSPLAGNINVVGDGLTITVVDTANTLTISTTGAVADTFNGDTGSAIPALGIIIMAGGNNITTSAAGHTVTYNVSGTTQHSLLLGNATGSINSLGVASNGQLPIGSAGADPVLATLTAGSGISITNGAGSITIASTGAGFVWHDVTGGSATLAAENGYIADSGSLTTFTMPTNNTFGDTIKIVGKGAGGWKIVYGASQNIIFGSSASTATTGNISSTNANDCAELVCTTASVTAPIFTIVNAVGNLSIT